MFAYGAKIIRKALITLTLNTNTAFYMITALYGTLSSKRNSFDNSKLERDPLEILSMHVRYA